MPKTSIMPKMNRFVAGACCLSKSFHIDGHLHLSQTTYRQNKVKLLALRAGIEFPDHSQDRFLAQIFVRAQILPIDNESLSGSHIQKELIVSSIIGKCVLVIPPSARINRFLHPHQKQQMKTIG